MYTRAVRAIEGRVTYEYPEIALQHALDPMTSLAPIALLTVAAALLGKAEDIRRPAVDLIIQTIEDGRFDATEQGRASQWLLQQHLGKLPRLVQPLRDASRVSPAHATGVLAAIDARLAALASTANGTHAVLELALEITASTGTRIESPAARRTLERINGEVSKRARLGKLVRDLLHT
jgi:hypothetical protein